jgi:hypothetical protein
MSYLKKIFIVDGHSVEHFDEDRGEGHTNKIGIEEGVSKIFAPYFHILFLFPMIGSECTCF